MSVISSEHIHLGKYQKVGGWLWLFCFTLTIGTPLVLLGRTFSAFSETSPYFGQFPGLQSIFLINGILNIILAILSIRAGFALLRIKPGAVKSVKNFLLLFLGYTIYSIFLPFIGMLGLPSEAYYAMIPEVVIGAVPPLLYFGIWYWYLRVSERVKATYSIDR